MSRTAAELRVLCEEWGVPVLEGEKVTNQIMINRLGKVSYDKIENPSWALTQRLRFTNPNLCFTYKNLKPEQQKACDESDDWIAEEKFNGCRCIIFYHPEEGFSFFSRNFSVEDFLPVEYTDKLLINYRGNLMLGNQFKGAFKNSFIIDSEVVTEATNIDTTLYSKYGVQTDSQLNAVSAILAINSSDSMDLQRTQAELKFKIFDILKFDEVDLKPKPLRARRDALNRLFGYLGDYSFDLSEWIFKDRDSFFKKQLKDGHEGIVYKNLNSPYIATSSRRRDALVKRKRSVKEALGDDIDAFITGFVDADPAKGWSHLVGAIEFSVILAKPDGKEVDHHICSISGLPMDFRTECSEIDPETNKPRLKEEYYGKVFTVNGQSITAKSKRFAHSVIDSERGWNERKDKSKFDCVLPEEFLQSQVM